MKKTDGSASFKDHEIDIFGKKVKVEFVPLATYEGVSSRGLYHYSSPLIQVSTLNQSVSDIHHTLLHEIGHAIFHRLGLHNCQLSSDLEEIIVDGYATALNELYDFKC